MAINNLRTQYYTENDGAGGAAQQAASIGLSLPADWATYSPQAKINWFNANGVTPDQLLQAGVSQGDIDWMSQNGYVGGGATNALATVSAPTAAPAQTSVLPANFDLAKGSQIIDGVTYSPQFENQTQGEGGLMEGGTLAAIQRHVPGQNTFDTLDPVTGQVIGTYRGSSDRGFFGNLVSHAGSIAEDMAPLALAALGVNALGAGLGQPSIFGPGAAAATGSGASTATLSSADKAALFGDVGYGAGMTGAQTAAYDAVIAAGGSASAAAAAAEAVGSATAATGGTTAATSGLSSADKAALLSDAGYGTGMTGAQTTAYDTVIANGGTAADALAAADAAAKAAADKAAADAAAKAAADKAAADAAAKTATTAAANTAATTAATDAATKVAATAATAATDPFAYLLPAIGSLIGGYTQGQSAKEAAQATAAASTRAAELQRDAQREALALQARMYDEAVARQQPYYQAGTNALAQMQQRTNAMPEAFQYGGEIPQFAYSGQQPAAFQYTGQQPTFEYGGQQPEAFKFTAENFQADPGYGFRLSEGLKALERSAAARGGLLSGGTGKALTRFGQDMASQEFQNAYGRAFNEYGAARQREQEQYGRALTGFDIARQREAQEYGRGLTGYDIGRQREQEQYGRALTGYNALRSRESDMYGRALTGYNALRQREADQYNRLAGLAGIGGTTAQQLTAAGQNYGSQAGNLMANTATNLSNLAMQQGQTAGNALLAQGAAYGRAFGDLGYLGGQYLGYPRP